MSIDNVINILYLIMVIVGIGGVCALIIIFGRRVVSILGDKHKLEAEKYIHEKNNVSMSPTRTKELHEFLKFLVTETAIIHFQKYKMGNDITKANRPAIQHLISDIASATFESLTKDNNLFDDYNLLTKDYYMRYITNIAMITVDKLINDAIDNIMV